MGTMKRLSRRDFLRGVAIATGALLAACAPATTQMAEVVKTQPTAEPKAPAAAPTATAVPPTAAPVAAAPTAMPAVQATATAVGPVETLIAKAADVAAGSAFDFTYRDKPAILVNLDGEYKAYRNVCTHNGCQTKLSKTSLVCPCHGSIFDAVNGEVVQGPAEVGLTVIDISIKDGSIYVKA